MSIKSSRSIVQNLELGATPSNSLATVKLVSFSQLVIKFIPVVQCHFITLKFVALVSVRHEEAADFLHNWIVECHAFWTDDSR